MGSRSALWVALGVLAGLLAAGCGVGAGDSASGGASITATRDFGTRVLFERQVDELPGGETVMRFLQRVADVDTGYGGRFVNAIEGVRSTGDGGARRDWFYYVNGIEADTGAAERKLHGGDRVWWDYRDWSVAMRVPAVVGSYPEPFAHGAGGKRYPVRIDCAPDAASRCREVADRMQRAGIEPSTAALGSPSGEELLRVVVGRWEQVRRDNAVALLAEGPDTSGVFARVRREDTGAAIDVLDRAGRVRTELRAGAGIVAATRFESQQPTWTVSGTDDAGLERAVRLLEVRLLRNRYAVVTSPKGPQALPAEAPSG